MLQPLDDEEEIMQESKRNKVGLTIETTPEANEEEEDEQNTTITTKVEGRKSLNVTSSTTTSSILESRASTGDFMFGPSPLHKTLPKYSFGCGSRDANIKVKIYLIVDNYN